MNKYAIKHKYSQRDATWLLNTDPEIAEEIKAEMVALIELPPALTRLNRRRMLQGLLHGLVASRLPSYNLIQ